MTFTTWTPQRAGQFFQVYEHAFQARPGFPGWSEDTWRHNVSGSDEFRADLSPLLLDGTESIGFAICHVEADAKEQPSSIGWIAQMGIRPTWRNRGLAGGLLVEIMQRFRDEGFRYAMLDVNINNPQAASVYQRVGFVPTTRYTSYQKSVR